MGTPREGQGETDRDKGTGTVIGGKGQGQRDRDRGTETGKLTDRQGTGTEVQG